jgi:hypothetical protein
MPRAPCNIEYYSLIFSVDPETEKYLLFKFNQGSDAKYSVNYLLNALKFQLDWLQCLNFRSGEKINSEVIMQLHIFFPIKNIFVWIKLFEKKNHLASVRAMNPVLVFFFVNCSPSQACFQGWLLYTANFRHIIAKNIASKMHHWQQCTVTMALSRPNCACMPLHASSWVHVPVQSVSKERQQQRWTDISSLL